jgi:hypothetical protein
MIKNILGESNEIFHPCVAIDGNRGIYLAIKIDVANVKRDDSTARV